MARNGFIGVLNAMARESARQLRQAEAAQRRQQRAIIQHQKQLERDRKLHEKESKQRYLQERAFEVDDMNSELSERMSALEGILEHTLSIDDAISFESLKVRSKFIPEPMPHELATPNPKPVKGDFLKKVRMPTLIERVLRMKKRYEGELVIAERQFSNAVDAYKRAERERKEKVAEFSAKQERSRQCFQAKVSQRNQEVEQLQADYLNGEVSAVVAYNNMVLERSTYPESFPQEFRVAYAPESKQLVVDYDLPDIGVVPEVLEYRYVKTKDSIEQKSRKATDVRSVYKSVVSAIALRTLHEVFEADQGDHLSVATFNGFVNAIDRTTGREIHPCILSVRTTKEVFASLDLSRVDKQACLKNLGANVSPQPDELIPVKPIVEYNMVDVRFIEQTDVLSSLDSRPNLMELTPSEFEALVSNLFTKMGLETKLTRSSRDGGVDAIAFDKRPVLGGKIVIQAKRYKHTVGVSAVRDLYGTMLNEGASKGILVATSGYGPDAYTFAQDKPIELIDGGGLLFLLEQVGVRARIVMPSDGM